MMRFLFKKIDNTSLIVFRIIFGLVLTAEAWGSIFTGWIDLTYIQPSIHFSLMGFEWLKPLGGFGMYFIYAVMGFLGLGVLLGYFYRIAIVGYTILWTYCYLIHQISYNNHYYLMVLLCLLMCFLPAHRYASFDVKYRNIKKDNGMAFWCKFILMFQIACVYFYGGIAKIYPDWLDGTFTKIALLTKANFPLIGQYFTKSWFYMGIAYGGLLFDLCIIPLLCFKRTRVFGFVVSILFHSFNSMVFQVGVFPYLSLSFAIFFFPMRKVQSIFLPNKTYFKTNAYQHKKQKKTTALLLVYCIVQLLLPIRQHFITGNTFWTEEAHKMSWRMMLRSTSGQTYYKIKNITTQKTKNRFPKNLTPKQKSLINTTPNVIWQYAQHLKRQAAQKGHQIEVYAIGYKSLNGRPMQKLTDPTVDLAHTKWNYFGHQAWIVPFKGWK